MLKRTRTARMAVLGALADSGWSYGLDLMRTTGLRSGRFYPAIHGLEAEGVVESRWDDSEPDAKHRRRFYRLAAGSVSEEHNG